MSLLRWIAEKAVVSLLAFTMFYLIGEALGIVPQSMKDSVAWAGDNFGTISFLICFVVGAYVVLKVINRRRAPE